MGKKKSTSKRRGSASSGTECFILCEPEAAEHAERLKEGLEASLGQRCATKVPGTAQATISSLEMVAHCRSVVLLQTSRALSQPWALLAMYRASISGVPTVCIHVHDGGYDFNGAKAHLEQLEDHLESEARELMEKVLGSQAFEPPSDLSSLQERLAEVVPSIISVTFDPHGTANQLAATVGDVIKHVDAARPPSPSPRTTSSRAIKDEVDAQEVQVRWM